MLFFHVIYSQLNYIPVFYPSKNLNVLKQNLKKA